MSGRSGGSVHGSLRAPQPQHELVLDALYERKRDKKSVRVLTVIVYVFCVSLAAIMLSLYYVFFWEPKDAQYAQRKVSHTVVQQTSTTPMPTCFMPYTGGSNSTIKVNSTSTTETTPAIITTEAITNENVAEITTSSLPTSLPSSTRQSPPSSHSLETTINNASTTKT